MRKCGAQTKSGRPCQRSCGDHQHCVPHTRKVPRSRKKPIPKIQRPNYKWYISSSVWKNKRRAFIDSTETSNDCYGCGATYKQAFHLHHLTYKNLGNEPFSDLVMVCKQCHETIHEAYKTIKPLTLATDWVRSQHGLYVAPRKLRRRSIRGIVV